MQLFNLTQLIVEIRVIYISRVQIDAGNVYLLFLCLFGSGFTELGVDATHAQNICLGPLRARVDPRYMFVLLQFAFFGQTEFDTLLQEQTHLVVEGLG